MIADAKVRIEEIAFFDFVDEIVGKLTDPSAEETYGDLDLDAFDTLEARRILILTLAIMALSDGEFHDAEAALLAEVRESLGIDPVEFEALMELSRAQGAMLQRIMATLSSPDVSAPTIGLQDGCVFERRG